MYLDNKYVCIPLKTRRYIKYYCVGVDVGDFAESRNAGDTQTIFVCVCV